VSRIQDNASVDRRAVEATLTRILSDAEFQKNVNSGHFLKFVVEETLAGRGDRLKGFTIAISALGRHSDFDPQSSSAVRVQATRVRRLLADYYRGPGSQDPMRIVLPLGSYRPRFERRDAVEPAASVEPIAAPLAPPPTNRSHLVAAARLARVAAAACLPIIGVTLFVWFAPAFPARPTKFTKFDGSFAKPPVVVVEDGSEVDATESATEVAELAVAAIEGELSAFDHFVVRRVNAKSTASADYVLSVRAGPERAAASDFVFQLVHAPTSEIVWSRAFPAINLGDATAVRDMTDAVVSMVGDIHFGAVMADERRRMAISNASLDGFACIAEGDEYFFDPSRRRHRSARDCAERALMVNPRDSRALALLSWILFQDYADLQADSRGAEDIERMQALALRAFEVAPQRVETSTTLFLSQFAAQRFDGAFSLARRLLRETPNSPLLSALVGAAYLSRGGFDEGAALLSPLENGPFGMPGFAIPLAALAAYMRDDETTAERLASRASIARHSIGLVMRIVICARQMDQTCVSQASQQLRRDYPGFAADVPTALSRHALADGIKAKLIADLRAAGFFDETAR
jgi:hypothetical protein